MSHDSLDEIVNERQVLEKCETAAGAIRFDIG